MVNSAVKFVVDTSCKLRVGFSTRRTCAFLSVAQMWGDGDGALLSHAHPDQTRVHAGDDVASAHVRVVGAIARVAAGQRMNKLEMKGEKKHTNSGRVLNINFVGGGFLTVFDRATQLNDTWIKKKKSNKPTNSSFAKKKGSDPPSLHSR